MRKLVLVIEDDDSISESLVDICRVEGLDVMPAGDGAVALYLLERLDRLPDLILLDLLMPNLSGEQFLEEKAKRAAITNIPVLVLTAGNTKLSPRSDIVGVLKKPFCLDRLTAFLRLHSGVADRDPVFPAESRSLPEAEQRPAP